MRRIVKSFIVLDLLVNLLVFSGVQAKVGARVARGLGPAKPMEEVRFSVDRGTGLSIDVSADGRTLVFGMMGDIFVLPTYGGAAVRLTSGVASDAFPRFSPDGRQIAFISDRSGLENIWVVEANGANPRQVTHNVGILDSNTPFNMREPVWSSDGRQIFVRRTRLRSGYSVPELWIYDIRTGRGRPLIGPGRNVDEPQGVTSFSLIGATGIVFTTRNPEGGPPEHTNLWYLNLATLRRSKLVEAEALLSSVSVSPGGDVMVYARTEQGSDSFGEANLWRCALDTGADGSVRCSGQTKLAKDLGPMRGSGTAMWPWPQVAAFSPDGKRVSFVRSGRIFRVLATGGSEIYIPFKAEILAAPVALNRPQFRLNDGPLHLRQLEGLGADSSGKLLVFGALGDIWIQNLGATARRLPGGPAFRFDPTLSPDGRSVAYTAWSDADGGSIWVESVADGTARKWATAPTHLFMPRWTRGGGLLFLRDAGPADGRLKQQVMSIAAAGDTPVLLAGGAKFSLGQGGFGPAPQPSISGDGRFAYLTEEVWPKRPRGDPETTRFPRWRLLRIPLEGGPAQPIVEFYGLGVQAIPSPDGKWLAIQHSYNLYLRKMPVFRAEGKSPRIDLTGPTPDRSLVRITVEGGTEPVWSLDSRSLSWNWMIQHFRSPVRSLQRGGVPSSVRRWTANLEVPRPAPKAPVLLTGARIITMAAKGIVRTPISEGGVRVTTDPGVIPCGDILIVGRRIAAIRSCGALKVPSAIARIDMSGKILMPGLIAMHEHRDFPHIPDRQPSELSLMLAHGLTTARDPGQGFEGLHWQELVDGGVIVGPRWFGTLGYMFDAEFYPSGEEIGSFADALHAVRKQKSAGAMVIKEYFKPHRIQRQWLAEAARREKIFITSDQYFQWDRHMAEVLDGYPGFEHAFNTCDVGDDVIGLMGRLSITYDPQLRLDADTATGAAAWLRSHPRLWWKGEEFDLAPKPAASAVCRGKVARDLLRSGANVVFGRDAGLTGLEQHIALWGFASGGMTNAEILRVATLDGARGLGMDRDLGSLEDGKIADIVVLDADPLASIYNTLAIRQVIKDGIIYDGDTLSVVTPGAQ